MMILNDTVNYIADWIIALAPAITSILSTVAVMVAGLKQFRSLKDEVSNSNRMEELEAMTKKIIEDNLELKKELLELTKKITKVDKK